MDYEYNMEKIDYIDYEISMYLEFLDSATKIEDIFSMRRCMIHLGNLYNLRSKYEIEIQAA